MSPNTPGSNMADPLKYGYFTPYPPTNFLLVDWKETPEAHVFRADVPGAKKDDVRVEVDDKNVLKISSMFNVDDQEDIGKMSFITWHRRERRPVSKLPRHLTLPKDAEVNRVEAVLKDGVLTVTVPKKAKCGASGHSN